MERPGAAVENVRRDLARDFGCDPEELAITRNASEGMEILILGIDLKRGDEVIVTDQNYGRMLTAWDQRARREGVVVKSVSFKVPLPSTASFVDAIKSAITPRTRVIEFPHIVNLTGTDPAGARGCANWPVRWVSRCSSTEPTRMHISRSPATSYDCDYFACSLHKWLMAPIGTGFLYVRKAKIKSIWPLMAAGASQSRTSASTRRSALIPRPTTTRSPRPGISPGHRRRAEGRSAAVPPRPLGQTPPGRQPSRQGLDALDDDAASCGITLVNIEGVDRGKLGTRLMDKHGILVTPIGHRDFQGIRVTPNIYATLDEIDTFGEVMQRVAEKGLS